MASNKKKTSSTKKYFVEPPPLSGNALLMQQAKEKAAKQKVVDEKKDDLDPKDLHKYHHRHITVTRPSFNSRDVDVYVGIDFGTSYTKAFFNSTEGHAIPIEWQDVKHGQEGSIDEDYFLPSTLHYEKATGKLYFEKEKGVEIRFFKYGMIQKELQNEIFKGNKSHLGNGAEKNEFIASIFFVANVIRLIKMHIAKKIGVDLKRIRFRFNMGCPIDNWGNEYKNLYWLVLKTAYLLEKSCLQEGMEISTIYTFYKEHKNDEDDGFIHVIPELYAEAYSFIEDSTTHDGFYTILDIGGGTVDFAVIRIKHINSLKKVTFISQSVLPLGIEMLLSRFYPKTLKNEYKSCKQKLRTEKEIIKKMDEGTWETLKDARERSPYEFRNGFNSKLLEAKEKDHDLTIKVSKQNTFPMYVYGGGANYEWYMSIIYNHNPTLKSSDIPELSRQYKQSNLFRLIVAENLANIRDFIDGDVPESLVNFGPCFVKVKHSKKESEMKISDYGIVDDR